MSSTYELYSSVSAQDLQELINTAEPDSTIVLNAGTYEFDQTISIQRDDIAIVGKGEGQTIIQMSAAHADKPVFQIGNDLYKQNMLSETHITAALTEGDVRVQVASDHSINVGDTFYIEQENTAEFFSEIGDDHWQKDTPLRVFMTEVVAVDGDEVILADALPFDFDPSITNVRTLDQFENVTLSGFSIVGPYGASDPSDFSNTQGDSTRASVILVSGTDGVTLSNISLFDVPSHGLTVDDSHNFEVSGLLVDGSHNKGSGGNGYAVWIRNVFDSSFEDLSLFDTRHAVLFGSYNTAIGNTVHVLETNRDINFHGGLDQGNFVHVESSVREGIEQEYMAAVSFFNFGTSYGAPTNAQDNTLVFDTVTGTVRQDVVFASDAGALISTGMAADTVHGGAGDDVVDLGSGHDTYFASEGTDVVIGGSGSDTAIFQYDLSNYSTYWQDGAFVVSNATSTTYFTQFEFVTFSDIEWSLNDVPLGIRSQSLYEESDTAGLQTVDGGAGWQRAYVDESGVLGESLEACTFSGTDDIQLIGNILDNHIMGGRGNDLLEGRDGVDRLLGRHGNDVLLGGAGNDALYGGMGNDTLLGGSGEDVLTGGLGADLFVGSAGVNVVTDFSLQDGDTIIFNNGGASCASAVEDFFATGEETGSLRAETTDHDGELALSLTWGEESLLILGYAAEDF